ncbi:MAG: amidohydrolase family protein [Acidobacteria bacterium]|nr:amidohydrolase family protein [Acidobacteriota bacterium]
MSMTRRQFLLTSGGAAVAAATNLLSAQLPSEVEPSGPIIDFHVHLFGVGDGGTGCYISEKQRHHITYPFFTHLMRLRENGRMDEDYLQRLVAMLRESSVQKAVLLSQDSRYDAQGRPDKENTSFYVPNDYLFRTVARFPDLFIPCVSINPKRRDTLEELDRCAELGARVLKIHPPIQDVDPAEARFSPFYRRCADKKIIVMFHTGTEHAAEIVGNQFSDPLRLVPALEEGCIVIASHSGFGSLIDKEDFFPHLLPLVRRFPNFYCDTAALAITFRFRSLPRMLQEPEFLERTLHASDIPFPASPMVFWNRLSYGKLFELATEANLFERDVRLKQALGVPAAVFERGAKLLDSAASRPVSSSSASI